MISFINHSVTVHARYVFGFIPVSVLFLGFLILCGCGDETPAEVAPRRNMDGTGNLPKMIDLGADKCIPCKMMAPTLEDLKKNYADKFTTEFIDVWLKENVSKAKEHKIKTIPTQIFFDAEGKELWRHEGYISKEDILKKWKELGYDFTPSSANARRDE